MKSVVERITRISLFAGLLLMVFPAASGQSPNLVTNPSFEQKTDFQSSGGSHWSKCLRDDTPDYIEFTSRGEPGFYYRKYIGGLLPYDGEAYAGIFCYRTNPLRGVDNVREFIQAPLGHTLQKDTVYRISLVIALDPESTTAINYFHVYFAREPLSFRREKQMFGLLPQVSFTGAYLDSISWVKLEADYKARGFEKQIVLGNFLPDHAIRKRSVFHQSGMEEKWNLHELERAAYYYIDMVSVVKRSHVAEKSVHTAVPSPEETDSATIEIGKVRPDSSIVLNNIYFEFDESKLLPGSYKELDRLYEQLQEFSELSVVIEGHTDNMGTYEYNMQLSIERAKAVVDYLLKKGLRQERVSYEGYGYTRPLSDNRSEEGRQLNRRVAFRVIK